MARSLHALTLPLASQLDCAANKHLVACIGQKSAEFPAWWPHGTARRPSIRVMTQALARSVWTLQIKTILRWGTVRELMSKGRSEEDGLERQPAEAAGESTIVVGCGKHARLRRA